MIRITALMLVLVFFLSAGTALAADLSYGDVHVPMILSRRIVRWDIGNHLSPSVTFPVELRHWQKLS